MQPDAGGLDSERGSAVLEDPSLAQCHYQALPDYRCGINRQRHLQMPQTGLAACVERLRERARTTDLARVVRFALELPRCLRTITITATCVAGIPASLAVSGANAHLAASLADVIVSGGSDDQDT